MALSFPKHWHFVDETERRKWQDPEAILDDIGLKPGITFMDIGCGEGFFTLPAARLVGASGKVYGLDIDEDAIEKIKGKTITENLNNLQLKVSSAEDAILCQACADIVFFGIVLHDFRDPLKVLGNARKMLKSNGRLVDLDWKKKNTSIGPPLAKKLDEATASQLIESAGFEIEKVKDSGSYHYLVIARPK